MENKQLQRLKNLLSIPTYTWEEDDLIEFLGFNNPIKEIPTATKEEMEKLFGEQFELNGD